jgi:FixJ family two-component response regulator
MIATPPKICVVDDDASFRAAIGSLLTACGYMVSLYEGATQLLEALPDNEPDCILLDVQMAGLSGPQLQNRLAAIGCTSPIVFVSGHADIPTTVRTIKAGAEDFLTKPIQKDDLLAAIERALARHEHARELDHRISGLRSLFAQLTSRELDVFAMLVRGKPHKQIAHALGVSERTIKVHRHNVTQKFKVQSLAELAVIAERLGLLAAPTQPQDVWQSQERSLPAASVSH